MDSDVLLNFDTAFHKTCNKNESRKTGVKILWCQNVHCEAKDLFTFIYQGLYMIPVFVNKYDVDISMGVYRHKTHKSSFCFGFVWKIQQSGYLYNPWISVFHSKNKVSKTHLHLRGVSLLHPKL